jgi:hypothetical protein
MKHFIHHIYLLFTLLLISIINVEAQDICFGEPTAYKMGAAAKCKPTDVNCKRIIPIENISGQQLNSVNTYLDAENNTNPMYINCGIDATEGNEGGCSEVSSVNMGTVTLSKATKHVLNDMNASDIDEIWTESNNTSTLFDYNNLYTIYTKDSTQHKAKVKSCITLGFKLANDGTSNYQVSEDYALADGLSSPMPITVTLSRPASFDVSINYSTLSGSAVADLDYESVSGTINIPAGDTEAKFYINIIHDPEIELDENFSLHLTNINPNDGSVYLLHNSATVTILEQGAENLPICYDDDFNSDLDADWRVLRSRGGFTPQIVNGRLRLTSGDKNLATAVTKDYEFVSQNNMIVAEFTQYAYGGCGSDHGGSGVDGADGIVMVLYDSAVGADPVPGGSGGSIGYAQYTNDTPGFEGGWLGLAIDEYGNFANCNEERIGGLSGTSCDNGTPFNPQNYRNIASIRGDGSGMSGYEFLAASTELNPKVAIKNTDNALPGHKYRMTTDARDPNHLYITLERDIGDGNGYQVIINKFDAKDSQYNQSTTPDYVRFAFTSGTGGGCNNHEIDDLLVKGVCRVYNSSPPTTTTNNADIVNNFTNRLTYDLGTKYITTKVAGKLESITGVHLNANGDASVYTPSQSDLTFKIIPYLSDGNCSSKEILLDENGNPAVISIADGEVTQDVNIIIPKKALKNARFSLNAMDFDEVYQKSPDACLLNSSTTGNLQGIGQCINSESKYKQIFGEEVWQRCYVNNGQPCLSSNNGVGDEPYNNSYGCLMCTMDNNVSCSSDNFAIRPDGFALSTSDPDFPNLLRSGEDYQLTIKAYNYNSPIDKSDLTPLYNITEAQNVLTFDKILRLQDGTPATGGQMVGSPNWSTSADFNMSNGISTDGTNNEVAIFNFNDVGKVTVSIVDKEWAKVDLEDNRSTNDPSSTIYNNCHSDGAFICGDINTTFIPHHFSFNDTNITNNDGPTGSFTYISNLDPNNTSTFNMSARIVTTISARNKAGTITYNFKGPNTDYYENPISLVLDVKDDKHGDSNATSITNTLLGFVNGEHNATWNENNNSKVIRFNFPRLINKALNPFLVTSNEVNITVSSIYTDGGNSATITSDNSGIGSIIGNIDNNATFIYGKTYASRHVFTTNPGNAFIYYMAYCNGIDDNNVTCNKNLLPNGINSISTDDPRWFKNTLHTVPNDGKVGTVTQKFANYISAAIPYDNSIPGQTTVSLTYNGTRGYPYKATMENNASGWLIYNKYDSNTTTNEFQVEFIQPGGAWAGKHDTDTTTDTNASNRTNRRLMW